jgi:hypothetical protein
VVLQYIGIVREWPKTLLLVVIKVPCQGLAQQILSFHQRGSVSRIRFIIPNSADDEGLQHVLDIRRHISL